MLKKVVAEEAGLPELPVLCNVNVGHSSPTGVFPPGLPYEIDCRCRPLTLLEPGTVKADI